MESITPFVQSFLLLCALFKNCFSAEIKKQLVHKAEQTRCAEFLRFFTEFCYKKDWKSLLLCLSTISSLQNFKSMPRREGGTRGNLSLETQCWISCRITASVSGLRSAKPKQGTWQRVTQGFLTHPGEVLQPKKLQLHNLLPSLHPALMI